MTSITIPARRETHPNLRAMNALRDLPQVADLIELCFSGTMDSEGQRYVRDMRRAGRDGSFLQWASRAAESTSLPLTGYIWEEKGRIVGNTSLVPFRHNKQRIYLIANVAVHPDFRRRGIARRLTERAMIHAREKRADSIWLHVRDDNPGAVKLYSDLGFEDHARRTTWQAAANAYTSQPNKRIFVMKRDARWWPIQQSWLSRLYPDHLAWHRSWNFSALRPGLWNWLYLFFVDMNIRQWAAVKDDSSTGFRQHFDTASPVNAAAQPTSSGPSLEAALAWMPTGQGESLYAAAGPTSDPEALTALLIHARHELSGQPSLSLEFPAGQFDHAIQEAGFKATRTLIWMRATS